MAADRAGEGIPEAMRSEEGSSGVLGRVCDVARDHGETIFLNGSCHTLALSLWIADAASGSLFACLELERGDDEPFYNQAEYLHMVYVDIHGAAWDVGGEGAMDRFVANRRGVDAWKQRKDREGRVLEHVWVPVALENLPSFLRDWHAADPLNFSMVQSLLRGADVPAQNMEASVQQLAAAARSGANFRLAPFDNPTYRRVVGSSFFTKEVVSALKAVIRKQANEI